MIKLNPYINFPGNTEEAFNFYKSVFGGEFATIMRFGDMDEDSTVPEQVMHIALPIGYDMLMGTDVPKEMGEVEFGNNFILSLSPESKEQADELFAKLSAGGEVEREMGIEVWGDYFGSIKDKFGMRWMINFQEKK